jgi:exosortase/archaeosortase family protein
VKFVITSLVIFIFWQLAYDLYFLPNGGLDNFLSKSGITIGAFFLRLFGLLIETDDRIIRVVGSKAVEINNGCNGLQLFGLFSGFIIAYPSTIHLKIFLLISGSILLFFANSLRIAFFVYFNSIFPQYWEIAHDSSSYIFFYPIVLLFWYITISTSKEGSSLISS